MICIIKSKISLLSVNNFILCLWILLYWISCVHCLPGIHYTFSGNSSPILLLLFKDLLLPSAQTMTLPRQTKKIMSQQDTMTLPLRTWEQRQPEKTLREWWDWKRCSSIPTTWSREYRHHTHPSAAFHDKPPFLHLRLKPWQHSFCYTWEQALCSARGSRKHRKANTSRVLAMYTSLFIRTIAATFMYNQPIVFISLMMSLDEMRHNFKCFNKPFHFSPQYFINKLDRVSPFNFS